MLPLTIGVGTLLRLWGPKRGPGVIDAAIAGKADVSAESTRCTFILNAAAIASTLSLA